MVTGRLRDGPRVHAILGPTNTGKTHRAIERMLLHRSGMIGLPLRLLAREVYDRVVALRGPEAVALVTGEERRVPANPAYWVCTVEAMPDRAVDFVAVDEVQLAGDRTRGHTFTDRVLNKRGTLETLWLGSMTIAPLLERLVPGIDIDSAPRLSKLAYGGSRKLSSVPPRSAVIAFSADAVYETAERLRAIHGGAAVVLGALSPRTRNAQVEMYQAGEVSHLVATDAIGMGLNLDVKHVAFTAVRKFDGRNVRDLGAAEIAQIAGRAGRFRTDGTFGSTRECGELDPELVSDVEAHRFPPLATLFWRNSDLDLGSPERLLRSLAAPPPARFLVPADGEDDVQALATLVRRDAIRARLGTPAALSRLWAVCRVPDYRKTHTDAHVELLGELALHLLGPQGRVPDLFVEERIARLARTEGDIETLMARIAWIRTWTYVAWQHDWTERPPHWQELARTVEDRLSDALHERLTARFVDRRAMIVRGGPAAAGSVEIVDGVVIVAGAVAGRLRNHSYEPADASNVHAAVRRHLRTNVEPMLERLEAAPDEAFTLDPEGRIAWDGGALGRLDAGPVPLEPKVVVHRLDLLEPPERERVRRRLERWRGDYVDTLFAPFERGPARDLSAAARGLVHALRSGLGTADRDEVDANVAGLTALDRKLLARLDVRLGTHSVYVQSLLKRRVMEVRGALWSIHAGVRPLAVPPPDGRASLRPEGDWRALKAMGYRGVGGMAVRADVLEQVVADLRKLARTAGPAAFDAVRSRLGCTREEVLAVVRGLGFRLRREADGQMRVVA